MGPQGQHGSHPLSAVGEVSSPLQLPRLRSVPSKSSLKNTPFLYLFSFSLPTFQVKQLCPLLSAASFLCEFKYKQSKMNLPDT